MAANRRQALAGVLLLLGGCGGGGGGGGADMQGVAGVVQVPGAVPVQVSERATGLRSPWSLAFLPDGRMLVTERGGTLKVLAGSGQLQGTVTGVPAVDARGQGGLLGVALDPAWATNGRIYFSFSEADPQAPGLNGTAVGRAVLDADARTLSQVVVIWRQVPKIASTQHFGSRLAFDREGALFVTLGERERLDTRPLAQDLTDTLGKVVRITPDGAAAPGNPAWQVPGALPEIWTLGHRNVQGAAVHPATGELWTSEHGPQGGDEINRLLPGRNYGWPLVSRGQEYDTVTPVGVASMPGMEDPLWVWEMRDGSPWTGGMKSGTAPAGIAFYTHEAVPQWRGNLFVAALAGQSLWRLTLEDDRVTGQERLLASLDERMRDVVQGPDGALYLLTDSGRLLRYGA